MEDKVALVHIFSTPKNQFIGQDKLYQFTSHSNVCLAWVDPQDVDVLLNVRDPYRCCGGSKKPIYRRASAQEIEIWSRSA